MRKYPNITSLNKFFKKSLSYKKKYELSDDEYTEIQRKFEQHLFKSQDNLQLSAGIGYYPNTSMARLLGYPITESHDKLKPSQSDDYGYVQDIIRMYEQYKPLFGSIIMQSVTYFDKDSYALNGVFDQKIHDPYKHIHPVIAALFLPKMPELEERMIFANMAGIINSKYQGLRIITKPDYELYYSMVIDPTDSVCDDVSTMRDIKNRVEVQINLWKNIYQLRHGNYYYPEVFELLPYIDKCKTTMVDNPDMMFLSDEGVILRRLLAIFSYRPIIAATTPVYKVIAHTSLLAIPVNTVVIATLPYVTYRLPLAHKLGQRYDLSQVSSNVQYYMENGVWVPRQTFIMDCKGPLIIYVPRRQMSLPLNISDKMGPFNYTNFNLSTMTYHTLNKIQLDQVDYGIHIGEPNNGQLKYFELQSVVAFSAVNSPPRKKKFAVALDEPVIRGHCTYLFKLKKHILPVVARNTHVLRDFTVYLYRPNVLFSLSVAKLGSIPNPVTIQSPNLVLVPTNDDILNNLPGVGPLPVGVTVDRVEEEIMKYGTIFVYYHKPQN